MTIFYKILLVVVLVLGCCCTFFITKAIYKGSGGAVGAVVVDTVKIVDSLYLPGKIKIRSIRDSVYFYDTAYVVSRVDSLLLDSLLTAMGKLTLTSYADTTIDSSGSKLFVEYFFPPKNKFFISMDWKVPPTVIENVRVVTSSPFGFGAFVGPGFSLGSYSDGKFVTGGIGLFVGVGLTYKF